jgi:hypothetical protein
MDLNLFNGFSIRYSIRMSYVNITKLKLRTVGFEPTLRQI